MIFVPYTPLIGRHFVPTTLDVEVLFVVCILRLESHHNAVSALPR